jgi:hypothetical protein
MDSENENIGNGRKTQYKYLMLLSYVAILPFARGRKRKLVFNIR